MIRNGIHIGDADFSTMKLTPESGSGKSMQEPLPFELQGTDHVSSAGGVLFSGFSTFTGKVDETRYTHLIFGRYCTEQVLPAVSDFKWQLFRASLKGSSTLQKLASITRYVFENTIVCDCHDSLYCENGKNILPKVVAIRVTNYINALKRGGQLK